MFVATSAHASVSFWPTSGRSASHGGGGGTVRLLSCKPETNSSMEDPSDVTTMTNGTSISATLTNPINVADQRLPTRATKRWCRG